MAAAEVGGLHRRIVAQPGRIAMHGDAAVFQHVSIVGDLQRRGSELFDQQHRHALFLDERIGFLDIAGAVEDVLARVDGAPARDLGDLVDADRRARELVPLPASA